MAQHDKEIAHRPGGIKSWFLNYIHESNEFDPGECVDKMLAVKGENLIVILAVSAFWRYLADSSYI